MSKVLVTGGGLVGLLVAMFLNKRGNEVAVFERHPDIREVGIQSNRSINLTLCERGLRALACIGLDWNLEEKRALIRKSFESLPEGGVLLVYEALIDDDRRRNAFGLLMSLNMLLVTSGGFVYTGAECESWMREAGFRTTRVEHLVGPDSMVVATK